MNEDWFLGVQAFLFLSVLPSSNALWTGGYGGAVFPHIKMFTSGYNYTYPDWYRSHIDITHGLTPLSNVTVLYVNWIDTHFSQPFYPVLVQPYYSALVTYFYQQGQGFDQIFLHYASDQLIPTMSPSLTAYGIERRASIQEDSFYK